MATERLSRLEDGRLLYCLKHCWRDGTTHVVFEPQELVEKLAALVPPPRVHLVRYHGILGPCASERDRIVPSSGTAEGRDRRRQHTADVTSPPEPPTAKAGDDGAQVQIPGPGREVDFEIPPGADFAEVGGQRVRLPKPAAETRILFVGDSGTEGTFVEPAESFPMRLQTMLAPAASGSPVRIINAGVYGMTTLDELHFLTGFCPWSPMSSSWGCSCPTTSTSIWATRSVAGPAVAPRSSTSSTAGYSPSTPSTAGFATDSPPTTAGFRAR